MDDRQVVDYFVVAGLPDNPLPLEEYSNEAAIKPSFKQDPITDITVINKTLGEKVPKGYTCVERTPSGLPADLNHGSIRCPEMYLCYRRSRDKPPLMDIGVLYEGKERVMSGCEVVHTTAHGNPANVNNSSSSRTYITFRRAQESTSSDSLVVVDICIILANKNEEPPLAYNRINKTLNKGMVGSDVYICYKKAMTKTDVLAYQPAILSRYPLEDYEQFPLPPSVPMFCLPMGATIECWSAKAQHPLPTCSTFILTGAGGEKVYGSAVTFYEEHPEQMLSDLQMRSLGLKNKHIREQYRILKTVHANKCICLLSHWPFFDAFKKFLKYLYRVSITGPHPVPIERHISHFMFDVPYPSPQRPRILVQLNDEAISLCMPEDSPLPQSGASFIELLRNLGPENCMSMLAYVLCEQKILIHSLRPVVLTQVAEAVSQMIFPFHWQCPYIPLCPLGLSDVLNAPCPFIVGIDSRYFDMYDPPSDVICVDLDTIRIYLPDEKKSCGNYKILPKKPARVLLDTLDKLFNKLSSHDGKVYTADEISMEMASIDSDFRLKKKKMSMEFAVQEAFLRFMACLLKGYKSFLNPIMQQPTLRTTDAASLFDMQGFLKSRDKACAKFFNQMIRTQMFSRFVEERSFVSDKDVGLAFFDECCEKVDEFSSEPKLIEIDTAQASERTVFITPPEPTGLPEGVKYSYNGFPELKLELFRGRSRSTLSLPGNKGACPGSPLARRTKQEIRSAQKQAQTHISNPRLWAKLLLTNCFSLWFIHLPAFVHFHQNKMEALKIAYAVLRKMHEEARLPHPDEVCYRVLMQLCGTYNKPGMAFKVFHLMKKHHVQPNAITYGYYNKVMLDAKWPSINGPSPRTRASILWMKLRHVLMGVAQFRRAVRRRSISLCSNSGSEFDQISHTSVDSYLEDMEKKHGEAFHEASTVLKAVVEEKTSTGAASDRGYSSLTPEDAHHISQIIHKAELSGGHSVAPTPVPSATSAAPPSSEQVPAVPHNGAVAVRDAAKTQGDRSSLGRLSFRRKARNGHDQGSRGHSMHEDKVGADGNHAIHRPRLGSIVRRSRGSITLPSGSLDTLKGSVIGNSAGLLMVSQLSLDNSAFLQNSESLLETVKRRRHKSAGEQLQTKARSNSLFASWRPRHTNGTAPAPSAVPENPIAIRFSELKQREAEDSLESERRDTEAEAGESIKDSGVGLDDHPTLEGTETEVTSGPCASSMEESCSSPRVSSPPSLLSSPQQGQQARLQIVVEGDEEGAGGTPTSDSSQGAVPKVTDKSTVLTASAERTSDSGKKPPSPQQCNVPSPGLTAASGPVKKLNDIGRTSSSPDCLEAGTGEAGSVKPAVPPDPTQKQSTLSLNETGKLERPTDFVLRRSQSLRRTNEAISGVLRFAARAAYSKFNEIKQSITTPIKSGSSTSLTPSVEERDSGTGDEESASTLRDRLTVGHSPEYYSDSDTDSESSQQPSQTSYGSAPSSSSFDKFIPLADTEDVKTPPFEKLCGTLGSLAMEVEMCSCTRCHQCHGLLYDEEIMAGWAADDSNLNTSCCFCKAKVVPHLQIYVKDWRVRPPSGGTPEEGQESKGEEESPPKVEGLAPIAFVPRRRCISECGTTATDTNMASEEESPNPSPAPRPDLRPNFLARSASIANAGLEVQYLSPLVLRKELEYVLENEGDLCLARDSFITDHPIIFWNLVWYFKRLDIPSFLPSFVLTSKTVSKEAPSSTTPLNNSHVQIRTMWDNPRIHDEVGMPMYLAYSNREQSTTVDALLTDKQPFCRALMEQVIQAITCNELVCPIRLVMSARKRLGTRRRLFRSMYRDILFLALRACGVDNIDKDSFDREYAKAMEKLSPGEVRRLQGDDKPRPDKVLYCRRTFSQLEL